MNKMQEAEVSLRFAEWLLKRPDARGEVQVAIDGALVRVGDRVIFPIEAFLADRDWKRVGEAGGWAGRYERSGAVLNVHSRSGLGDVVAMVGHRRIRAECKGGPLLRDRSSREYPKLREALGQLLTVECVEPEDVMVAVVPDGVRFRSLAERWRKAPLVVRAGIAIALVAEDGQVDFEL